jgi:imidazolonepropionase-like amidohydrolase
VEGVVDQLSGNVELLDRSLLERVAPPDLIAGTREHLQNQKRKVPAAALEPMLRRADANLVAAERAGVLLITGSDAGNMLVIHGPTVQHELELWVKAGIPPGIALQAATHNAAKVLRAGNRIGMIAPGYDASLVLLDGDPVQDISNTERIEAVFFRGEEISRSQLLTQTKQP